MDKTSKVSIVVALIAIVIAISGYFTPQVHNVVGGVTTGTAFPHGISVGLQSLSATNIAKILVGTCNAQTSTAPFAATSTSQFVCTAIGARAGDLVTATLPVGAGANSNGPGAPYAGFDTISAYATTSDQIGFTIANLTGAATSSYAQATTGVEYMVMTTQ